MLPITDLFLRTNAFDEFDSLSYHLAHHATTYDIGLAIASTKTTEGNISEVLSANSKRVLNKFLTEYDRDEVQFNHERLEELKKHGETRWWNDGYIILDVTITEKAGSIVPAVGQSCDHTEGNTVWGKNFIYAFDANDKTAFPLTFCRYEQYDDKDSDHDTKYELARKIVSELEEWVSVPTDNSLFGPWLAHGSNHPEQTESYSKNWIDPLRSNRPVTCAGEETRVDALSKRNDTTGQFIKDFTCHISIFSSVSKLDYVKPVIAEKETDEDKEDPVKYLSTIKVDALTEHINCSYGMWWRIETPFKDSKQNIGLGDWGVLTDKGASADWHRLTAAYSLVRLDPESSTLGTFRSKTSLLRSNLEDSLKEAVYNFLPWVRHNNDQGVNDFMEEICCLFVHSTAD